MNNIFTDYLNQVLTVLTYRIFSLGGTEITPLSFLYFIILTGLLLWGSKKLKNIFVERILGKTQLDLGARIAIGTIVRYVALLLGFLIIIQSVGIDLTTLNVLAGAIGIGVGFGLQNVASNFISGLIILFERPVKVGDRIEVGEVNGKVIGIGARSTTVRTNDNITIIVPNSKFIEENVVNWSFRNESIRFRIPVGVSYDSDLHQVKKILLDIAEENPYVLADPKPAVRLIEFGDSSMNVQLWVWTTEQLQRKTAFVSALNFSIWEKFRENDIEIPFPQTDLHIKSGRIKVKHNGSRFDPEPENFNELAVDEDVDSEAPDSSHK